MTTPNDNIILQDEYDYLWQALRDKPDDFDPWEQLIRVAETPPQGLTKTSPPEHMVRLENVYDSFLTRYPLFYVYWKKYADWQLAVFERASCIGFDFLAHPFWDKYTEFTKTQLADPKRLLALLDRIAVIPMHQYAQYYEHWYALRTQMTPAETLDPDTLTQWTQDTKTIYKKTQGGTHQRWIYEAEIKRPYLHFKPLDRPQLQNWRDQQRIRVLYERCFFAYAHYEEFWMRYGQWLAERAAYTFLSCEHTIVKIALALVLEKQGKADDARQIYSTLLESMPTHIEVILNYLHFECRQNPNSFHSLVNN
ncbi:uncharacterized protein B0P05DRAFT_579583 [Gilbertella persicaria]|uniref:uncharacterized protein n=1 Tax=Gilbertella persicaria TaxID=101096 RepID=UPI00221E512B|nr:uncharacterized protein B0P05DRAFT_579583 [Gilbertella persicaria]KAI8078008.1 hypothetical protein B0P05DRAFT_579583 [Gilbertella persicaria]